MSSEDWQCSEVLYVTHWHSPALGDHSPVFNISPALMYFHLKFAYFLTTTKISCERWALRCSYSLTVPPALHVTWGVRRGALLSAPEKRQCEVGGKGLRGGEGRAVDTVVVAALCVCVCVCVSVSWRSLRCRLHAAMSLWELVSVWCC